MEGKGDSIQGLSSLLVDYLVCPLTVYPSSETSNNQNTIPCSEMLIRCRSLDDSTSSDGPLPSSLYSFLCIQKVPLHSPSLLHSSHHQAISDDLSRLQLTVLHNQMLVTLRVVSVSDLSLPSHQSTIIQIYCDNLTSYSNHLLQLASREAECCKVV